MSCAQLSSLLEQYYDGELDAAAARRVAAHLSACAACAEAYEQFGREQEFYLSYESRAEPSLNFWPATWERAREQRWPTSLARLRRFFVSPSRIFALPRAAVAALLLLALGLTAGTLINLLPAAPEQFLALAPLPAPVSPVPTPAGESRTTAPPTTIPGSERATARRRATTAEAPARLLKVRAPARAKVEEMHAPSGRVLAAEREYLSAIALLTRDVHRTQSRRDPQTRARFDEVLNKMDQTIAGTRRAVRESPDDPVAVQYMFSAYAKKVEVLREMIGYEERLLSSR